MTKTSPKIERHWQIGFLIAVVLLLYGRSIAGAFVWDDRTFFIDNDLLTQLRPWDFKQIFFQPNNYWGNHLPVRDFLYVVQFNLFGTDPTGYHVVSLVLYSLLVSLVFIFCRSLYEKFAGPASGDLATRAWGASFSALAVTLFFLIHPVHVEVVAYITGQKDLLYALFSVLALIGFFRCFQEAGAPSRRLLVASTTAYYLAFLSKGFAISTALFIPLLWLLTRSRTVKESLRAGAFWGLINLPVLAWLLYTMNAYSPAGLVYSAIPMTERLLRAVRILGAQTVLVFKPFPLNFGYPFDANGSLDLHFGVGAAVLVALVLSASLRPRSLATLGLLLYVTYFFPVLRIFVEIDNAMIYDRYLFVPLLGLGIALERGGAFIAGRWTALKVPLRVAAASVAIVLCALTLNYIPKFRSDVASLEHAYRHFPNWNRPAFEYVYALIEDGQYEKALNLTATERLLEKPGWVRDFFEGWILLEQGQFATAKRHLFKASLESHRGGYFPFADVPLARALIQEGNLQLARNILTRAMASRIFNPLEYYRAKKLLEKLSADEPRN